MDQFAMLSIITLAALGRRIDDRGPINPAIKNYENEELKLGELPS